MKPLSFGVAYRHVYFASRAVEPGRRESPLRSGHRAYKGLPAKARNPPFADGVDGAPNGIKRATMVVVESAIWKGAVRGQVYHRYLVCHARRA